MKKGQYRWQSFRDECDCCGGHDIQVLTDTGEDNYAFDGDEARCRECRNFGHVFVDEESACVRWHECPPNAAPCQWCVMRGEVDDARRLFVNNQRLQDQCDLLKKAWVDLVLMIKCPEHPKMGGFPKGHVLAHAKKVYAVYQERLIEEWDQQKGETR